MTAWNDFVKKIYHEGHNKDKSYSFKQALQDSSRRKAERHVCGRVNVHAAKNPESIAARDGVNHFKILN